MKALIKIGLIGLFVALLVLVRMFEYRFFYDPFMFFFEQTFQEGEHLNFSAEMFFNLFLRFLANTLISLSIIWIAFRKWSTVKFAALIYAAFFLILFPLFIYLMLHIEPGDYLAAFYVRRFLAHPVLVLILLPAFFYQKLLREQDKNSEASSE